MAKNGFQPNMKKECMDSVYTKEKMKKLVSIVLAFAMVIMIFTACKKEEGKSSAPAPAPVPSEPAKSSTEPEPSKSSEGPKYTNKYNIACIYSSITGDFWGVVYNGCVAALDELKTQYGIEGYCTAPATSGDYTQQMDLLDQVLLKKPDGMVLCPSNADSIGTYVTDKFTDDSIPIIVIDRSLNSTSPAIIGSYASDAYSMSVGQFEMAKEAMADYDEVTFIHLGMNKENAQWANRSYGFMDKAKEDPKFISYTGDEPYWAGNVTQDICIQYLQDTINSNPDKTILILGTCNAYNNYAVTAVSELSKEKKDKITIIGWDFSATEKGFMESGEMYGAMGQNPYLMGYDSTFMLCDYLEGYGFENKFVPYQAVSIKNINSDEVKAYMKTMGML